MIPVEYLRECFEVDSAAGSITWKERPDCHFGSARHRDAWRTRHAGKSAGRIGCEGYSIITLTHAGRTFKLRAHRVIWAVVKGAWPSQQIDHINRAKADNRIANLRDVDGSANQRNRGIPHSGLRAGVAPSGRRFKAIITARGRQRYLGTFGTEAEAHAAYLAARGAVEA